jgi:hypothetical protein
MSVTAVTSDSGEPDASSIPYCFASVYGAALKSMARGADMALNAQMLSLEWLHMKPARV